MESEYGRRFWAIETLEEGQTVARLLQRRFPQVFESLSEIFEQADPLDVVYPGNPNEYSDVIREIIVLLAPVEGKIGLLTPGQVEELVKEGLGRCFDDEPIERRVQDVVRMITARFKVLLLSRRILMSRTERQGCKRISPSSSRLVQLLTSAVLGSFSGCVPDRDEEAGGVVVVEAGDGVAEIDGDASREAGRQQEDTPFPAFTALLG
jgi:hypothetical protein